MCTLVGNQQSRVVIARLRSSVQSLLHQRRDLHQSTYLYLSEDQEPTSPELNNTIEKMTHIALTSLCESRLTATMEMPIMHFPIHSKGDPTWRSALRLCLTSKNLTSMPVWLRSLSTCSTCSTYSTTSPGPSSSTS
jgi:hypothetical protein